MLKKDSLGHISNSSIRQSPAHMSISAKNFSIAECPLGFHNVYDHCVQFRTQSATWHEMSNECFNVGADMVKLDDTNFMYYLVNFIKDNGNTWLLSPHHQSLRVSECQKKAQ